VEDYVYTPADKNTVNNELRGLWDRVGSTFEDNEDGSTWIIVDVCTCNLFDELFFAYHMLDESGELEYSCCTEIIAEEWSRWV